MKKINYLNKNEVYDALVDYFPMQPIPVLPDHMRGLSDPDIVYGFFSGREWGDIANNLKLKDHSYALELGILFIPESDFFYYIPLYIYASLYNKSEFWVFESDFIQQYLCPEYRNHDDFLNFILRFTDDQLLILAQFIAYESEILKFADANKACRDFWGSYL